MLRARLTSKGQITIPVTVRRMLNLQPGDVPATKEYPGKEKVHEEVVVSIARQILGKDGIQVDNSDLAVQALQDMAEKTLIL